MIKLFGNFYKKNKQIRREKEKKKGKKTLKKMFLDVKKEENKK